VPASVTLKTGTPGVELDEQLERRDDESIIHKKYASAFFGTDFSSRLTTRGIDTTSSMASTRRAPSRAW
jgi:maleamate amidohydrolase